MNRHAHLKYKELVNSYQESLTTVLRGFRPDAHLDFLDTWVYEEDPVKSILNIIEAAQDAELASLSVEIENDVAQTMDRPRFERLAEPLGTIRFDPHENGWLVSVTLRPKGSSGKFSAKESNVSEASVSSPKERAPSMNSFEAKTRANFHPVYKENWGKFFRSMSHEGTARPEKTSERVVVSVGNVKLSVWIDAIQRTVVKAFFKGASSDLDRGILEGLCFVIEGKPIQECLDHAVIRLEHLLRDPASSPPVPGIVTPKNSSAVFHLPFQLMRRLRSELEKKTGDGPRENFYHPPVSVPWSVLSDSERISKIKAEIDTCSDRLEMVRLEGVHRVVVRFIKEEIESGEKQHLLMRTEKILKTNCELMLELYMEPRYDQNGPRQLKGVRL